MRVPIRMIGIATTFFWIFLIAFFVTAVYSVKDVAFDFGEPQFSSKPNGEMSFSLPVTITNRGFYNIGAFAITTGVLDNNGLSIVRGSTIIPVIRTDEDVTVTHNMTFNASDLLQYDSNYLFNDTDLRIYGTVGMRIAEVIPVEASTNFTTPWGAPFNNFTLSMPIYTPYNSTHSIVTIPVSFENHALFDVAGDIEVQMYNSADRRAGTGQTTVAAYANSPYSGFVEFYVRMSRITTSGRFEVHFSTPMFSYGPLVIPYG